MREHADRGELAINAFGSAFPMTPRKTGECALLRARGFEFRTESWQVGDAGTLCTMKMRGALGLMRMETVVFAPKGVDAPLFNIDWVRAFGTETQIAELYNVQLEPWPYELSSSFDTIHDIASDLPDMPRKPNWYDDILYPCSCAKKAKGKEKRLAELAMDYIATYAAQLEGYAPCNAEEKGTKVRAYAERLFEEGGVAVDQVEKLFGSKVAYKLIVNCLYGLD